MLPMSRQQSTRSSTCTASCTDTASAAELCAADRTYILSRVALASGQSVLWQSGTCPDCGARADVAIKLDHLPCKPAGSNYPYADIEYNGETCRIRVPVSRDFGELETADEAERLHHLLQRCAVGPLPATLDSGFIALTDAALQAAAPEIPETASTACPDCTKAFDIIIDLAGFIIKHLSDPLQDVHSIASAYHWSEEQILSLSRKRRKFYIDLINRERGMMQ